MRTLIKAITPLAALSLVLVILTGCAGKAGAGVAGATIDSSGHLIISLSNGATSDVGYAVGPAGATGDTGAIGATGAAGTTGATGQAGPTGSSSAGGTQSVSSIIANITPSMVYLSITFPGGLSYGSGIIIGKQGYILTCFHKLTGSAITVSPSVAINVTLSTGTTIPATYVTGAYGRDWAVIKLNSVPANLQVASLGSSSTPSVGDHVVLGGFALDYTPNPSFSYGIISAFRLYSDGYNYVQTDAAMNQGDGGGPLLNMSGQVIGINATADVTDTQGDPVMNMAYCLPMSELLPLIQAYVG